MCLQVDDDEPVHARDRPALKMNKEEIVSVSKVEKVSGTFNLVVTVDFIQICLHQSYFMHCVLSINRSLCQKKIL